MPDPLLFLTRFILKTCLWGRSYFKPYFRWGKWSTESWHPLVNPAGISAEIWTRHCWPQLAPSTTSTHSSFEILKSQSRNLGDKGANFPLWAPHRQPSLLVLHLHPHSCCYPRDPLISIPSDRSFSSCPSSRLKRLASCVPRPFLLPGPRAKLHFLPCI